jgi:hypothetical protein
MWDDGAHTDATVASFPVTPDQLRQNRFTVAVQRRPEYTKPSRCQRHTFDLDDPYDCSYEFDWSGTATFERVR